MINKFDGEYGFLSNFHQCPIDWKGMRFYSSEAIYQGEKTGREETLRYFKPLSPGKAKQEGKIVPLRPDWDDVKLDIMNDAVYEKFKQNPDLAKNY